MHSTQETNSVHFATTTYDSVQWPQNEAAPKSGAVVFVKDGDSDKEQFLPIYHHHSITLRDLAEEFNISSVLECDAHGSVQPRTVALDSPSDVLHVGRHYIAYRDARSEAGTNRVTFRGRIVVQEYELDHSTPNSACTSFMQDLGDKGGAGEKTDANDPPRDSKPHLPNCRNPNKENEWDGASGRSLSRASSLGNADARKRARSDDVDRASKDRPITYHHDADCAALGQVRSSNANDSTDREEQSIPLECTQFEKQSVGLFLPFKADLHGDGVQVMIHLEDLKILCGKVDAQEAEFLRRGEETEKILEGYRKKLLLLRETQWN